MSNLAIVVFEGQHTADEALLRLMKMERDWEVNLNDVAVLTRNKEGKIRMRSTDRMTADGYFGGAALGSIWGLLIGALANNPAAGFLMGGFAGATGGILGGALGQADAEDAFAASVGNELKPDSSALAVIGWTSRPTKLLDELEGFKGKVIETSLSVSDEKALREVLEKSKSK